VIGSHVVLIVLKSSLYLLSSLPRTTWYCKAKEGKEYALKGGDKLLAVNKLGSSRNKALIWFDQKTAKIRKGI
jgi:hypothetical protein